MPQFDLSNFVPQLFWLTIFFAILYFGIVKATLPKLGRVMEAREGKVTGDLAEAEAAKRKADGIAEAYDASIAEAQANARTAVNEAKAEAARSVETRLSALSANLAERQAQSEAELASARQRSLGEIEAVAAEAAAEIVERLTGGRPDPAEARAAAGAALQGA